MKKIIFALSLSLIASASLVSCLKKEYNPPPDLTKVDPNLPVNLTIAQLKDHFGSAMTATAIDSSWIIYGIVTTEDRAGNFYKQITIEDSTGGITIIVDANSLYSKLPMGRKVYVKLKGLYFGYYNRLPQIGYSADGSGGVTRIPQSLMDNYIIRANYPNPIPTTKFDGLAELSALNNNMLNRLVTIENVEVTFGELGRTYAEIPDIASGTDITITDCNGKSITLRNSAFANFQSYLLPRGKGSITALYTTFGAEPQLVIRDTSDMKLYANRCDGSSPNAQMLLNDEFTNLDNWNAQNVLGAQVWGITTQYGNPKPCAIMNGYASGNNANEDWLISKELNLSGFQKIGLQFESASKFTGPKLETYISTNYTGTGLPSTATWTLLSARYDESGNFTFTPSGIVDLSAYKGQKVYIAFKYTSTTSGAASWELDNVRVTAE